MTLHKEKSSVYHKILFQNCTHPKTKSQHFVQNRNTTLPDLNTTLTVINTSVKNIYARRKDLNKVTMLHLLDTQEASTPNQQNVSHFGTQDIHNAGAHTNHPPHMSKTPNTQATLLTMR